MGGKYDITAPIELTAEKLNNKNVNISAYNNESPVLNGGKAIPNNLIGTENGLWKAYIGKALNIRNLYVDDCKAQRGRYPNRGEYFYIGSDISENSIPIDSSVVSKITSGNKNLEMGVNSIWLSQRMRVNISESGSTVNIFDSEWERISKTVSGTKLNTDDEYWFENDLNFVDSPGEWYYDKGTGYIYYYPFENNDIETSKLYYGFNETFIQLEGTDEAPVSNVTINGITFKNTTCKRANLSGLIFMQGNTLLPANLSAAFDEQYRNSIKKDMLAGAVQAQYSNNVVIKNCTFNNIGGNAINFTEGGDGISIDGNVFKNISGSAIEIGGDYYKAKSDNMYHKNVSVSDNYMKNIADEYYGGIAVLARYADGLTIKNNTIKNTSYSGISAGWGWVADEMCEYARNYTIADNRLENCMSVLKDGGYIYTTGKMNGENFICGNYIKGSKYTWDYRRGLSIVGIYHDGSSSDWNDYQNVIEMFSKAYVLQEEKNHETSNISVSDTYVCQGTVYSNIDTVTINNIIRNSNPDWGENEIIAQSGKDIKDVLELSDYETYKTAESGSNCTINAVLRNNSEKSFVTDMKITSDFGENKTVEKRISVSGENSQNISVPILVPDGTDKGIYPIAVSCYINGVEITRADIWLYVENDSLIVYNNYSGEKNFNSDGECTEQGSWQNSALRGYNLWGTRYTTVQGNNQICYYPNINKSGRYAVYVYKFYTDSNGLKDYGPVSTKTEIYHCGITDSFSRDYSMENKDGKYTSGWEYIGAYDFDGKTKEYIKLSGNSLRASAVKLEPVF